jgi:hypothetical protein
MFFIGGAQAVHNTGAFELDTGRPGQTRLLITLVPRVCWQVTDAALIANGETAA